MTHFVVDEFAKAGITLIPSEISVYIAPYLRNADAPGYFDADGFVQGGVAPDAEYAEMEEAIMKLVPYNPWEISNLEISFSKP
jgi:hypothetical protein